MLHDSASERPSESEAGARGTSKLGTVKKTDASRWLEADKQKLNCALYVKSLIQTLIDRTSPATGDSFG